MVMLQKIPAIVKKSIPKYNVKSGEYLKYVIPPIKLAARRNIPKIVNMQHVKTSLIFIFIIKLIFSRQEYKHFYLCVHLYASVKDLGTFEKVNNPFFLN